MRARQACCALGVPGAGRGRGHEGARGQQGAGPGRGVRGWGAARGAGWRCGAGGCSPGWLTLRGLPTESSDEHLAAGGAETQRARVSAGRQGAGGAGSGPGEAPARPGSAMLAGPGWTWAGQAGPGRAGPYQGSCGESGEARPGWGASVSIGSRGRRGQRSGGGGGGGARRGADEERGEGGRTDRPCCPLPRPRSGGRAGTAKGRARRGPTCRLLPPPPCAHKARRAPRRPRRRWRRDPPSRGAPGRSGGERGLPDSRCGPGPGARLHPSPTAARGPAAGTPSRDEALPGAFKVARLRIGNPPQFCLPGPRYSEFRRRP